MPKQLKRMFVKSQFGLVRFLLNALPLLFLILPFIMIPLALEGTWEMLERFGSRH